MQRLSGKAGMVLLQLLPDLIVEVVHGLPEKGAYLLRCGSRRWFVGGRGRQIQRGRKIGDLVRGGDHQNRLLMTGAGIPTERQAHVVRGLRLGREKPLRAGIGAYCAALVVLNDVKVSVAVRAVSQADVDGFAVIGRGQSPRPYAQRR